MGSSTSILRNTRVHPPMPGAGLCRSWTGTRSRRETPMKTPAPFAYRATDLELDDLRRRLRQTRLPPSLGSGWGYGMDHGYLSELVARWSSDFDWRAQETRINAVPNYTVELGGRSVHFVHVRGEGPDPIPL